MPIEGVRYPITIATVEPSRVRVTFDIGATWHDWCALQTPIAQDASGDRFGCLPNTGFTAGGTMCSIPNPAGGSDLVVDCGKLLLCEMTHVCACTATACTSSTAAMSMDFHVAGNAGDGTIQMGGLHNIHLTR